MKPLSLTAGVKEMNLPWVGGDYFHLPPAGDGVIGSVNCLQLTSILNSLPCSLLLSRDHVRLDILIRAARTMVVAVKQSGHLSLDMYIAMSLLSSVHLLIVPPPVSLYGSMYLCLFVIPLLASTPFTLKQVSSIQVIEI